MTDRSSHEDVPGLAVGNRVSTMEAGFLAHNIAMARSTIAESAVPTLRQARPRWN